MSYKYNPFTDKLDKVKSKAEQQIDLDDVYVNETGDTMTGLLNIALPSPSTEETALAVNKNIVLKAGIKLIFDGDLT